MPDKDTMRDHLEDVMQQLRDIREERDRWRNLAKNPTVHYAGRDLTTEQLIEVVNLLGSWLLALDRTRMYSVPNGPIWNAIDEVMNRG